jgi:hypothetical protein
MPNHIEKLSTMLIIVSFTRALIKLSCGHQSQHKGSGVRFAYANKPPDASLTDEMTLLNQLICKEAITKGGIAAMSIN